MPIGMGHIHRKFLANKISVRYNFRVDGIVQNFL